MLDDADIKRTLIIAAHPDDVDFSSAGTIARWTAQGLEVIYCIVTDGDAGGSDPDISRSDMAAIRRAEQTAAASQVGVHDLRFLGYPDARNPFAFPELLADEGLEAWVVPEVWISGGPASAHYVDVTETFPQKIAALQAHESQVGQRDGLEGFLRERMARLGEQGGLPEGRLAEAFQVIDVG